MFNQKASQYSDPNTESFQTNNSYHEELFSSSSSSSSSPNHSVNQSLKTSNESSNLLKESPQRQVKTSNNFDNKISREEKALIDFGNNDIKVKKNSSAKNDDWNTGWDDEAWNKLEVDMPKAKNSSKRS